MVQHVALYRQLQSITSSKMMLENYFHVGHNTVR